MRLFGLTQLPFTVEQPAEIVQRNGRTHMVPGGSRGLKSALINGCRFVEVAAVQKCVRISNLFSLLIGWLDRGCTHREHYKRYDSKHHSSFVV